MIPPGLDRKRMFVPLAIIHQRALILLQDAPDQPLQEAVGDILNTAFYHKIIVCIQKNAELRKRIY